MADKRSRIQAPSLQELLTAFSAGTGGRPLTEAAQGFERSFTAGRAAKGAAKRADQELGLRERAQSLSEKINQQNTIQPGELDIARTGEANLPGVPGTSGEVSIAKAKLLEETRQNALEVAKPEKKKYIEASEANGKITFVNQADPKDSVVISAPTADQFKKGGDKAGGKTEEKIPTFLLREDLQGKTITDYISTLDNIVEKMGQNIGSSIIQKGQSFAKGQAKGDNAVLTFDAQRPAFGRALYKNISGDVGNIAQSEGDIGTAMLPSLLDSPGLRKAKVKSIKRALTQGTKIRKRIAQFAKENSLNEKQYQELVNSQVNTMLLTVTSGLNVDEDGKEITEDAATQVEAREDELAVELSDIERQIAELEAEAGISQEGR